MSFNSKELIQFLIYAVIGVWNTVLDFALFWLFINLFDRLKWPKNFILNKTVSAHCLSFIIANVQSYFLNKTFAFAGSKNDGGFLLFFLVSCFTLGVSSSALYLITKGQPKDKINKKRAFIGKIVASAISMIVNYLGYKFIVF